MPSLYSISLNRLFQAASLLFKQRNMTKLLLIFLLPFCAFHGKERLTSPPQKSEWEIQGDCELAVQGRTNINSFCCSIKDPAASDTLIITAVPGARAVFSHNMTSLDVSRFNCGNKLISRDFRRTLKARQYPKMKISFLYLDNFPLPLQSGIATTACVQLEIGGCSKPFGIDLSLRPSGDSVIIINGCRTFRFSDFGLTAPHASAGLIKVKEDFRVDFRFVLKRV